VNLHPIATIAALLVAFVAQVNSWNALNRADESDRRAHALELRINYLEGALTLEGKIDRDMRALEVKP